MIKLTKADITRLMLFMDKTGATETEVDVVEAVDDGSKRLVFTFAAAPGETVTLPQPAADRRCYSGCVLRPRDDHDGKCRDAHGAVLEG